MAKKITIQHYYTTGSTAPAASALTLGEIAIATSAGTEAIFIKNSTGGTVDFPTRKQIVDYVDLKTKGIATSGEIETLDNKISEHITGLSATDKIGHVELVGGDLSGETGDVIEGKAAASHHTHGQYLETTSLNINNGGLKKAPGLDNGPASYGVKAGIGIEVDSSGVSISKEYQGKITSGATAYSWGDHKTEGYAKNSDLTSHTGNTDIHVTTGDKEKWNSAATAVTTSAETWNETTTKVNASASTWNTAAERINTFMDSEKIDDTVDTLKEIQQFLDGTGSTVQTLLDNLDVLTTDVENNTTAITKNTKNITTISGNVNTITSEINTLKDNQSNFVTHITGDGYITVENESGLNNRKLISHNAPTSASTKIEGTATTGLSFGDSFTVVSNLGYDAKGHVVTSATTASTFTLPELPIASASDAGIVKLMGGDLAMQTTNIKDAAAVGHTHSQYVKFADLSNYDSNTPLIISCGTY